MARPASSADVAGLRSVRRECAGAGRAGPAGGHLDRGREWRDTVQSDAADPCPDDGADAAAVVAADDDLVHADHHRAGPSAPSARYRSDALESDPAGPA